MAQSDVLRGDPLLREEIISSIETGRELPQAQAWNVTPDGIRRTLDGNGSAWEEAVVMAYARPVLRVQSGRLQAPASPEWSRRLRAAGRLLEQRVRAVGRVVMTNHPRRRTAGSAWLSSSRTCITTRSVADDLGDGIEAWVEFPAVAAGTIRVRIEEVIRARTGDVAVLRIADDDDLPQPIPLSSETAEAIAVVSYLTPESEAVTLTDAARRVVGITSVGVYVAPGRLSGGTHDATIAGDATGGVILDVVSGAAVGMHGGADRAILAEVIAASASAHTIAFRPRPVIHVEEPAFEPEPEAPDDYLDRDGYDPAFLGTTKKHRIELPTSTSGDELEFEWNGETTTELTYRHFSVVMSRSRQLCLYSAVNIDGENSEKDSKRYSWRKDRRLEDAQQIFGDVYGPSPRFSRGHMTRREDPIWGSEDDAKQGNRDSMHFTNVAPQMQPFNAPVWLGLEEYALRNARKDKMRISVFTGPFFGKSDPIRHGVRIPLEFWKVIAFIHDETKRLTATGYKISQEEFLSPLEFVFGEYEEAQIPITLIEKRAKLDFHGLAKLDPLFGEESGYMTLTSHDEIRFF